MRPEFIILTAFFTIVICGWLIGTYNKFIKYQNLIEEAWSSIDVALKRRFNLVPNLVSAIKGYSEHESEIFENKTNQMKPDNSVDERMESESQVTHSLSNLLAVAEAYPDLKANQNFLELQAQLEGTENRITVERRKFNESARAFNTYIRSFPKNIYANLFGFEKKAYFEAEQGAEKAPEVSFD